MGNATLGKWSWTAKGGQQSESGSKAVSSVLPQPLLQFLTQGPCPIALHDGQ